MNWLETAIRGGAVLMVMAVVGCHSTPSTTMPPVMGTSLTPAVLIPNTVRRIAVFYPRSAKPEFIEAYHRLEGATFQLKGKRSTLRIIDRFNLRRS
jgi:hypothetical protein